MHLTYNYMSYINVTLNRAAHVISDVCQNVFFFSYCTSLRTGLAAARFGDHQSTNVEFVENTLKHFAYALFCTVVNVTPLIVTMRFIRVHRCFRINVLIFAYILM